MSENKNESNSVVRNLVKEITRECHLKKIQVNQQFLEFLIKIHLINPIWGITDNYLTTRINIQNFVKFIIENLLMNSRQMNMITFKIQFYFSCHFQRMKLITESNRNELKLKLIGLRNSIVHPKNYDKEQLYIKIVNYIILSSGLGDPKKTKVFEETLVTFKSFMDANGLKEFNDSQSINTKIESLDEFIKIVTGIRLFNKNCFKGGEGIADLPFLLHRATKVTKETIASKIKTILNITSKLIKVIDKCYIIQKSNKGFQLILEIPEQFMDRLCKLRYAGSSNEKEKIDYLVDLLILFKQYEIIMRKTSVAIEDVNKKSDLILTKMNKQLEIINLSVYMKSVVPVGQVFPLFIHLAEIWFQLQDQAILISKYNEMIENFNLYSLETDFNSTLLIIDQILKIIPDTVESTDVENGEQFENNINSEVEIVHLSDDEQIDDEIVFEYLGFCPWKLVETNGALISANPDIGIAVYQGRNFVFSSIEGIQAFCSDPDRYIKKVLNLARNKPQLIHLFQLEQQLKTVFSIQKLEATDSEMKTYKNESTSTEIHPIKTNIDKTYKWNVWDWKKEILAMANLSHCRTVSTNTTKTHGKSSCTTQIYRQIETVTNTRKADYINTIKPSRFIANLRGYRDSKHSIIQWNNEI